MEKESIDFIEQLLRKLKTNISKLEKAKENNDPREFNEIKKDSFNTNTEIDKLISGGKTNG